MPRPTLTGTVRSEWVDFYDHMGAAWFAVAFAEANSVALEWLQLDADWRSHGHGIFIVEATYRYRRELHSGDRFQIETRLARVDAKRLWLTHRMTVDSDDTVAEADILFLHVSMDGPKAAPFTAADHARLSAKVGAFAATDA